MIVVRPPADPFWRTIPRDRLVAFLVMMRRESSAFWELPMVVEHLGDRVRLVVAGVSFGEVSIADLAAIAGPSTESLEPGMSSRLERELGEILDGAG